MTMTTLDLSDRIERILAIWGTDGSGLPGEDAWKALAKCSDIQPVTLVNFFKMRDFASYPVGLAVGEDGISGDDAFQRYAAVSMPSLEKVGGRFLLVAPFSTTFIGAAEDWDLVAIGSYPNPDALLSLFELKDYREAYHHRTAACRDQKVSLCIG
ncbi:protein of unknown function [Ruegeria halocynthiae]|uniref:DUF1330 domain-containing protein n=1 Tax=Ruegeria halocynthiae TaxID=985054 RepID=A0A1H2WG34_9RHOB|nr:DUF1330 domain-containing protein [Ruegeria halocynthiae]SDW79653.1 protein of unknown function [Ruegeria halocynthiae]